MKLDVVWDLLDAIKTAIVAAESSWTVEVMIDPTTDVKNLPSSGIELHLMPCANEEGFVENSRQAIGAEVTIGMRMRSRLGKNISTTEARAKSLEWDKAVKILQRPNGFDLGAAGHYRWHSGAAGFDQMALRKDHVISICSTEIVLTAIRRNPRWGE